MRQGVSVCQRHHDEIVEGIDAHELDDAECPSLRVECSLSRREWDGLGVKGVGS
jgi:hypothetical protein